MSAIATAVVVVSGLLMIAFTVVVFAKREAAERFLSHFASSARTHYLEQVLRLLAGAALIVASQSMWQPTLFWLVGCAIVISSAVLMCIPWQWHHRFGERIKPLLLRYLKLYAVGAFALGLLLLYGVLRGPPVSPLPATARADLVVVRKAARILELYNGSVLLRAYHISLGSHPDGPKQREGDGRTPEGKYTLDYRKENSSFHLALHISYPSATDAAAANNQGVAPGGLIMIHGIRNGLGFVGRMHTLIDWTDGCIAVTNMEIEEIWRVVPDNTPISIEP